MAFQGAVCVAMLLAPEADGDGGSGRDPEPAYRNSTFVRTSVSTSPSFDSSVIRPDGESAAGARNVNGDHRLRLETDVAIVVDWRLIVYSHLSTSKRRNS